MADPAVDDMGPAHALAHRIHTAVDFRNHSPADDAFLLQHGHLADVDHRN